MIYFEARSFYSELQRQLNRESSVATMEVVSGTDALQVTSEDGSHGLRFGSYAISPLSGLHFDSPRDTALS